MHRIAIIMLAALAMIASAQGAEKPIQLWNLASITIAKVYFSPAGKETYGANDLEHDDDGSLSADEQLKIFDLAPG